MKFPDGIWVYGDKSFDGRCALEKYEASTFFALLRHQYPNLGLIATHMRNEGKRSKWQGARFKAEGMVTGASDIVIPGCPTFVCELKRRNHRLSDITEAQVNYLQACKSSGAFVCIALGADAAMRAVERWTSISRKLEPAREAVLHPKQHEGMSL